jgi:Zn-dependent protease
LRRRLRRDTIVLGEARRVSWIWNWNFRAFRAFAIDVRVHWTLPALFVGLLCHWYVPADPAWGLLCGATLLALLWVSILLHELGHCFAARAKGIDADEIVLWPLGGLAMVGAAEPRTELLIAAAGPAVTAALVVVFGALALAFTLVPGAHVGARYLLENANPLGGWILPGSGADFASVLCLDLARLNLIGLVFNVFIPAPPLDGGRMLRAFLAERTSFERATEICFWLAVVAAAALAGIGIGTRSYDVAIIGLFVVVQAWIERRAAREAGGERDQTFMGHDFSMGYTSLGDAREERRERRGRGLGARLGRLVQRGPPAAPAPERGEPPPAGPRDDGLSLRQRVDRLLEKVAATGLASLTPDERRFLDEASRRLRDAHRPGG